MKLLATLHGSSHRPHSFAVYSIGLFSLVLGLASCGAKDQERPEVVPSVRVFTVGKVATGQSRRLSGTVEASDQSTLSFGVGGQVVELPAKKGQRVVKGELLARLDPDPLRIRLEESRASLSTSRADLVNAKSVHDRTFNLFNKDGASKQELDDSVAALAAANSQLQTARGRVRQAELDAARGSLLAPFAGRIVDVPINVFQDVGAAEAAFVVQTDDTLDVVIRVPETLIHQVDFGQVVQATFPSVEGVAVEGVITSIGAAAESGNAFEAKIRLADTAADIRPGFSARVTLNFSSYLDGRTAYLLPISAIAIEEGLSDPGSDVNNPDQQVPVFVFDQTTETVVRRDIQVGDLRGNEIEVFDGLAPGDLVVSAGVVFLRPGMKAKVWNSGTGKDQ